MHIPRPTEANETYAMQEYQRIVTSMIILAILVGRHIFLNISVPPDINVVERKKSRAPTKNMLPRKIN